MYQGLPGFGIAGSVTVFHVGDAGGDYHRVFVVVTIGIENRAAVVDFNVCGSEGGLHVHPRAASRQSIPGLKDHILLGNRTGFLVVILQVDFDPAAAGEVLIQLDGQGELDGSAAGVVAAA